MKINQIWWIYCCQFGNSLNNSWHDDSHVFWQKRYQQKCCIRRYILLLEEILHQLRLIGYPMIYDRFWHPRWCRNSSINSGWKVFFVLSCEQLGICSKHMLFSTLGRLIQLHYCLDLFSIFASWFKPEPRWNGPICVESQVIKQTCWVSFSFQKNVLNFSSLWLTISPDICLNPE